MSYAKCMKWHRSHPKGTHQPMLFSTQSGFWPSGSWIANSWNPYADECQKLGIMPMHCQKFYDYTLRGRMMSTMPPENQAEYTRLRRLLNDPDFSAPEPQQVAA